VVHDTSRGSEDKETELTRWKQVVDPGFNVFLLDVEARGDDTGLVDTTNKLDYNLARSVIIDNFEFTNVT
jgi:hypothetical protein